MSLLLDTHVVLWWLADAPELPDEIKDRLDQEPDVRVSAATIWEITIKRSLGRQDFTADARVLRRALLDNGYAELPVTGEHAINIDSLPPKHKDPFDRMLVAQATVEGITLLTHDRELAAYPGPIRKV